MHSKEGIHTRGTHARTNLAFELDDVSLELVHLSIHLRQLVLRLLCCLCSRCARPGLRFFQVLPQSSVFPLQERQLGDGFFLCSGSVVRSVVRVLVGWSVGCRHSRLVGVR